jgi:exodeoxyribonuclease VII small subunit
MPENDERSFEECLAELEGIVKQLETGDLALEQSLLAFERGVGLVRRLQAAIEQAEQRVEVLMRDAEGRLRLEPLRGKDVP